MTHIQQQTLRRLELLMPKCRKYNDNPQAIPLAEREELSMMFAATFKNFKEFAELGMRYLGFKLSLIQADIAEFMQYGQAKRM